MMENIRIHTNGIIPAKKTHHDEMLKYNGETNFILKITALVGSRKIQPRTQDTIVAPWSEGVWEGSGRVLESPGGSGRVPGGSWRVWKGVPGFVVRLCLIHYWIIELLKSSMIELLNYWTFQLLNYWIIENSKNSFMFSIIQ